MSDRFRQTTWGELREMAGQIVEVISEDEDKPGLGILSRNYGPYGHNGIVVGFTIDWAVTEKGVHSNNCIGIWHAKGLLRDEDKVIIQGRDGWSYVPIPVQVRLARNIPPDTQFSYH